MHPSCAVCTPTHTSIWEKKRTAPSRRQASEQELRRHWAQKNNKNIRSLRNGKCIPVVAPASLRCPRNKMRIRASCCCNEPDEKHTRKHQMHAVLTNRTDKNERKLQRKADARPHTTLTQVVFFARMEMDDIPQSTTNM